MKLNITAADVLDVNKATGGTLEIKGGSDDSVSDTKESSWTKSDTGSSNGYSTDVGGETVVINIDKNIQTDL